MVKLDPAKYACPDHGVDLTSQVEEVLEEDGPPVAYLRLSLRGRRAGPRPFEVIVTCPGTGQSHQLTAKGTLAP